MPEHLALISMISAGTPQTGLWCDRCLLPSRVRVPVYVTTEGGSFPVGVYDKCRECGFSPAREAA